MKSSSARSKLLQLELDASGDLGQAAVEGIELARLDDLLVRGVPFALRVVEAAEDFVGAIVVRRLQLGDLEQLDGLRGLVLGHVVLRQADVLRGIDLVARALRIDILPHRLVPRRLGLRLRSRDARQVDAHGDGARLELLRHLVQMDGFVVHPLIGIAPRQRDEIVGVDGDAPFRGNGAEARACWSCDRGLGHGRANIMAECFEAAALASASGAVRSSSPRCPATSIRSRAITARTTSTRPSGGTTPAISRRTTASATASS